MVGLLFLEEIFGALHFYLNSGIWWDVHIKVDRLLWVKKYGLEIELTKGRFYSLGEEKKRVPPRQIAC